MSECTSTPSVYPKVMTSECLYHPTSSQLPLPLLSIQMWFPIAHETLLKPQRPRLSMTVFPQYHQEVKNVFPSTRAPPKMMNLSRRFHEVDRNRHAVRNHMPKQTKNSFVNNLLYYCHRICNTRKKLEKQN